MAISEATPIRVMRIIARMNVGGPAVQVSGLMREMDRDDFDQRLYTGFCTADEADYLETVATDVNATRILGFGRRVSLSGDLKAFFSLIKEIRSFKPHVIHTHTAKAGFLGRLASILSLNPSIRVHTFHGHLLNGYFKGFKRFLIIMTEKALAQFTHQLLAVGDQVRADLLEAGIGDLQKFGLMPPGLKINKLPDKNTSLEFYGLKKAKLHCALIGRVTRIKRPDRFLDVVSELKQRGVDLDFFIAGDGELMDQCREKIQRDNLPVTILGWQSDIERILSAADIVILTSDNEGTPLCLIQAGMASLPVVTTGVGSVPEIVIDKVSGFITSLDVNDLADALCKLVNSPGLRQQMGRSAKEYTTVNFGLDRLVHDHEELYKRLLVSTVIS
jgi:glycosyltransferase involved in cell wall biosynthesis